MPNQTGISFARIGLACLVIGLARNRFRLLDYGFC
jgi:hypothetical protein